MAGMSRKEIAQLIDHLEPQGVTTTRTTKGILLRFPNGDTSMVHFSGSDHRERLNVRSRVKRAGLDWPGDHKPLPASVTDHRPQKSTLAKVEPLLAEWPHRNISGAQLRRLWAQQNPDAPAMFVTTANRALYHLGWKPHGNGSARKWLRPFDQLPEPDWDVPQEAPAAPSEPEPAAVVQLHPDTAETAASAREFIDSVDSWAADTLPDELTLGQLRGMLTGLGLGWELRVWRA